MIDDKSDFEERTYAVVSHVLFLFRGLMIISSYFKIDSHHNQKCFHIRFVSLAFTRRNLNPFDAQIGKWCSGGRLNKKDGLTRYGNSHVKDKTS